MHKALEAFINYCDDMIIANESMKDDLSTIIDKHMPILDKGSEILKTDERITAQIQGHKLMKEFHEKCLKDFAKLNPTGIRDTKAKEKRINAANHEIKTLNETLDWLGQAKTLGVKDMDDLHKNYIMYEDPATKKAKIKKK